MLRKVVEKRIKAIAKEKKVGVKDNKSKAVRFFSSFFQARTMLINEFPILFNPI
jgi:hypothetical protein